MLDYISNYLAMAPAAVIEFLKKLDLDQLNIFTVAYGRVASTNIY